MMLDTVHPESPPLVPLMSRSVCRLGMSLVLIRDQEHEIKKYEQRRVV
jgi:hypothetical protein